MASIAKLSSSISKGQCALPGGSASTKALVEKLLYEDYQKHHCFYTPIGLHNHLNHHVFAAYDLGAPTKLLQVIHDDEVKLQRPKELEGEEFKKSAQYGQVTVENWTQWLGDSGSYAAYLEFFAAQIASHGTSSTISKYIFAPSSNANGAYMLARLVGGAFHPLIQLGYGVEFHAEFVVAEGLAQTAVHKPDPLIWDEPPTVSPPPAEGGLDLFGVLREIYDSEDLVPVLPYDNKAFLRERVKSFHEGGVRTAALRRVAAKWKVPEDLDQAVEECVTLAAVLTGGTSRVGHKPRADFFLMHALTSSHFLRPYLNILDDREHKVQLLQAWLRLALYVVMLRGRPRIDPTLLMSYTDSPAPPSNGFKPGEGALDASKDAAASWSIILADALHHPESHVIKSIRALYHAATLYGERPAGWLVPKDGKEMHKGLAQMDGSVYLRTAGVIMDGLGWVTHGQKALDWDRSALGWDGAWE